MAVGEIDLFCDTIKFIHFFFHFFWNKFKKKTKNSCKIGDNYLIAYHLI